MRRVLRVGLFSFLGLIALIVAVAVGGWLRLNPSPPSTQLFINGVVLTMDDAMPLAEAVLVEDGIITRVGVIDEVEAGIPSNTVVTDLAGNVLMPGIIDAHGHFPGWGVMSVAVDLNSPPIGTVQTIAELKARIAAKAEELGPEALVVGMGYDDTLLKEGRHPTRWDLDEAAPNNPVIVIHISGHMLVGNSRALDMHNITKDSFDPKGGEIVRDENGVPTGLLKEKAADPLTAMALSFEPEQMLTMLQAGTADYLKKGVTLAQNGFTERAFYEPMGWAARLGAIPLRLSLLVDAPFAYELADTGSLFDFESDRFHVAGVKIITDGSIQGYTGFLRKPYWVAPDPADPHFRGYPIYDDESLQDLVNKAFAYGVRPYLHGNGDAAIDQILGAVDAARKRYPNRASLAPVIIHAQMMRPDQIRRAKALNVEASFFNAHIYYWGDRHKRLFLGPDRAARLDPVGEADRADLPYTLHLDTPVVPMDPWLMIWSAVTRETSSGEVLGPDQRISVMDAIKATTLTAAQQIGLGDKTGSITPGKWADLIVIDTDPQSASPDALRNTKVLKTYVGGVERYSAEQN